MAIQIEEYLLFALSMVGGRVCGDRCDSGDGHSYQQINVWFIFHLFNALGLDGEYVGRSIWRNISHNLALSHEF